MASCLFPWGIVLPNREERGEMSPMLSRPEVVFQSCLKVEHQKACWKLSTCEGMCYMEGFTAQWCGWVVSLRSLGYWYLFFFFFPLGLSDAREAGKASSGFYLREGLQMWDLSQTPEDYLGDGRPPSVTMSATYGHGGWLLKQILNSQITPQNLHLGGACLHKQGCRLC